MSAYPDFGANLLPTDLASLLSFVTQGTLQGPLLFLIYINEVPERISPETQLRLFANNSLLYQASKSQRDVEILQQDLVNMDKWEK